MIDNFRIILGSLNFINFLICKFVFRHLNYDQWNKKKIHIISDFMYVFRKQTFSVSLENFMKFTLLIFAAKVANTFYGFFFSSEKLVFKSAETMLMFSFKNFYPTRNRRFKEFVGFIPDFYKDTFALFKGKKLSINIVTSCLENF